MNKKQPNHTLPKTNILKKANIRAFVAKKQSNHTLPKTNSSKKPTFVHSWQKKTTKPYSSQNQYPQKS